MKKESRYRYPRYEKGGVRLSLGSRYDWTIHIKEVCLQQSNSPTVVSWQVDGVKKPTRYTEFSQLVPSSPGLCLKRFDYALFEFLLGCVYITTTLRFIDSKIQTV